MSETNADDFIEITPRYDGRGPDRHGPQPPRARPAGPGIRAPCRGKDRFESLTEQQLLVFLLKELEPFAGEIEETLKSEI
jgi:hypothetical protein